MKFDATATAMFRVLNDALQFASPKIGVPAIESVRIETVANGADSVSVLGVATDRFVLGVSRVVADGDTGFGVTLSSDDVKTVLKIAKTAKRDANWRRVTVEQSADGATVTFTFTSGESVTVRPITEDFPKFRQLLVADTDNMNRVTAGIGFDPLKVAQFARVAAAKEAPMQFYAQIGPAADNGEPGRLKPIHVRIGEDFYGLLMPVRAPGGQLFAYEAPAWLGVTPIGATRFGADGSVTVIGA